MSITLFENRMMRKESETGGRPQKMALLQQRLLGVVGGRLLDQKRDVVPGLRQTVRCFGYHN